MKPPRLFQYDKHTVIQPDESMVGVEMQLLVLDHDILLAVRALFRAHSAVNLMRWNLAARQFQLTEPGEPDIVIRT